MVLAKLLIGKKSFRENLGVGPTFQSFNDSGELSHSHSLVHPVSLSPQKPSMVLGRAKTSGTRPEVKAEKPGNLDNGKASAVQGRLPVLRAPSLDRLGASEVLGVTTEEQSSGYEFSEDEDSSWSSYDDQIPEQFHMSSADTVNAPAQFVPPISIDNHETTGDNQNEGSQSESSLLHFTPYFLDECHLVHPDDTQSEDGTTEIVTNVGDVSTTTKSHETEDSKLRQKQRRPNTKPSGSRLKRKEMRSLKYKREGSINESNRILPTNDQHLMNNMRHPRSECFAPEAPMCISPCPRSPTKTLRAFKRTGSALTPKSKSSHSAPHMPGNAPLRPLSGNMQLPILNPLDISNSLATAVQYSVDLHRQTPVKQRQKYVLGDPLTKPKPSAEIEGYVPETKQPIGPRRGSLQHGPRPHVLRHQPRRTSCPTNAEKEEDDGARDAEEAFERVMDLIDSHTRVVDVDSTLINSSTWKKKPTVEDMKRKMQKDRERNDEKKRNPSTESSRAYCGAKRLQSPRRSKGRTARRLGQPVSMVSFDPPKENSGISISEASSAVCPCPDHDDDL